jgi:hypothetical protein
MVPARGVLSTCVILDETDGALIRFGEPVPLLVPHTPVSIPTTGFIRSRSLGDVFGAHLDPRFANRELRVVVEYENIEGLRYETAQTSGPNTLRIHGVTSKP